MSETVTPSRRNCYLYAGAIILIAAFRAYLCFQLPISTGDIYRQLGFSSHAFEHPASFYESVPFDYSPEAWTPLGGFEHQVYIYPPLALIFFAAFSTFGLGIIWVKLALLLIDLTCALVMGKYISRVAGILLFAAPQAIWFSSREGQFEGLQSLFMMLTALAVWRGRFLFAGLLFGFALQTKLLALFLVPWLFYETIRQSNKSRRFLKNIGVSLLGVVASFLPFLPFYWGKPLLILAPLQQVAWRYSSYFWNAWSTDVTIDEKWLPRWIFYFDNFGSLFIALSCIAVLVWAVRKNKALIMPFSPYSIFWLVVKSGSYVRSWYLPLAPAFLFPVGKKNKSLVIYFLILQFLVSMQGIDFLIGNRNGYIESESQEALYKKCMYRCVFKHKPRRHHHL